MEEKIKQNGNSTILKQDEIPEEVDFSFGEDSVEPDAKTTYERIKIGAEFYKRVGFYCAFNENPKEEFRRALSNLNGLIQAETVNLTKDFDNDITRFKSRKEEADNEAKEIKQTLCDYESEVTKLEEELSRLRILSKETKEKIKQIVIEIGSKKETLIKDRQEALLNELNQLNTELEAIVRKRMDINDEIFLKQKDVLEAKRRYWQGLFAKCEKEHNEVLNKLSLYGLAGYHHISSGFLYNIGLISAGVAGAFFAFFAEVNLFASGGVLSFIIKSLFTFSTEFISQNLNVAFLEPITKKVVYAGILLLIFILLLGLVFLVSLVCQSVYQRIFEKKLNPTDLKASIKPVNSEDDENFAVQISLERDDLPIKAKMFEKSFLGFWIKVIPSLLFLAICFVLISLGTDVKNLASLDASLAGYGIGFMIALVSAGILYIYLTMIVERRIEKKIKNANEDGKGNVSWLWLNLELILSVLAFIGSILVVLIYFQHPFKSVFQTQSIASLLLFAGCSLLTAFTLGFGIRFQSLETAREVLELSCDIIQTKIIRLSRPLQINLTEKENKHFNTKFIQIRDEIMNLMLSRTRATRNALNTPLIKEGKHTERRSLLSSFNSWVRNRFSFKDKASNEPEALSGKDEVVEEKEIFTASEEIKLCFPKLEAELSAMEAEAKETHSNISSTEKEIIYRKEHKGEFYEKKLKELDQQERRSRSYHKAITNREKHFHEKENTQKQRMKVYTQRIIEGYELGNWFVRHNPPETIIPKIDDYMEEK